mmetsp:Transcript_1045/g.2899  ORF Transcript_1045/g.2899 Transcript_1045/m.2899 type:complete len:295 (-) Transcript_1045:734-1618(-)
MAMHHTTPRINPKIHRLSCRCLLTAAGRRALARGIERAHPALYARGSPPQHVRQCDLVDRFGYTSTLRIRVQAEMDSSPAHIPLQLPSRSSRLALREPRGKWVGRRGLGHRGLLRHNARVWGEELVEIECTCGRVNHVDLAVFATAHRANLARHLREFDPSLLLSRRARRDGHHKRHETVLTRARGGLVVDEGIDKGERLLHVRLLVPRHEEVVWHIRIAGEVGRVDARCVRVVVVSLDHRLLTEHLRALVVAVGSLAANVDHRIAAVGELHEDRRRVESLGAGERLNGLVNLA